MSDRRLELVRKWLEKADHDLLNIENNLSAQEIPADTVCFHAQQAIEKCLKAALMYFERNPEKVHDLVLLLSEVQKLIPELEPYGEQFERISDYAVGSRYPDYPYDPTIEDAREAFNTALEIKEIIVKKLGLSV
jgi:HEPN domain-containing protein